MKVEVDVEGREPPLERTAAFVSRFVPPLAARTPDGAVEPVEPPLAAGPGTVTAGAEGTGTGTTGACTVGTGTGNAGTCGTGTGAVTVGTGSGAA